MNWQSLFAAVVQIVLALLGKGSSIDALKGLGFDPNQIRQLELRRKIILRANEIDTGTTPERVADVLSRV